MVLRENHSLTASEQRVSRLRADVPSPAMEFSHVTAEEVLKVLRSTHYQVVTSRSVTIVTSSRVDRCLCTSPRPCAAKLSFSECCFPSALLISQGLTRLFCPTFCPFLTSRQFRRFWSVNAHPAQTEFSPSPVCLSSCDANVIVAYRPMCC